MKHTFIEMLLSAIALLAIRFTPAFFSRSLGAKSGVIVAASGTDEVVKAVASSEPARGTLAQIAVEALAATDDECTVVINFGTRKAVVVAGSPAGLDAAIEGAANVNGHFTATIVKDDETKPTSQMTATEEDATAISALLLPLTNTEAKPAMSVASLVSKIEDLLADPAVSPLGAVVVIDQVNKEVRVFQVEVDRGDEVDTAVLALGAEKAVFDQTIEEVGAAAERQFGE